MHFALHGHTAEELIVDRADHKKDHMGLTSWTDAPDGKIKKSDVTVAKNYLSENEMQQLNRMVTAYLDFAESMTLRHVPLTMQDWEKRLNSFIEMFEYGLLKDAGKVSAEIAKLHAETEFEKYRIIQDRLIRKGGISINSLIIFFKNSILLTFISILLITFFFALFANS